MTQNMRLIKLALLGCFFVVGLVTSTHALAYTNLEQWNSNEVGPAPFNIPVYVCEFKFSSVLGLDPADSLAVAKEVIEVWNRQSGANIRTYFAGVRQSSDATCQDGFMGNGAHEIIMTAAQTVSCASGPAIGIANIFPTSDPFPHIVQVQIQIAAQVNPACSSGGFVHWTNTGFTANANQDFESTLLHEMGHSLGLGHASSTFSVMSGSGNPTFTMKRHLAADDAFGLLDTTHGYGWMPASHFTVRESINNGVSWTSPTTTLSNYWSPWSPSMSIQAVTPSGTQHGRFVQTRWGDNKIEITNADFHSTSDTETVFDGASAPLARSAWAASVASSGDGYDAIVYADTVTNPSVSSPLYYVLWRYNNGAWNKYALNDGNGNFINGAAEPALTYYKNSGAGGVWVLAQAIPSGALVIYTATDVTSHLYWVNRGTIPASNVGGFAQSTSPVGLSCPAGSGVCYMAWTDATDPLQSTEVTGFNVNSNGTISTSGWSSGRLSVNGGGLGVSLLVSSGATIWAWATNTSTVFPNWPLPFVVATGPNFGSVSSTTDTGVHTNNVPSMVWNSTTATSIFPSLGGY